MAHVRQQVRAAAVARRTGLATTGSRVDSAPVYPLDLAAGPRLGVSVADETAESLTMGAQPTVQRTVTLTVEGHAVATAGVANVLDAVAAEVETALGGLLTVGSVEVPLMYTGASIEFSTDLDRPVGRVSLSFTADLFTVANQPEVLTQA